MVGGQPVRSTKAVFRYRNTATRQIYLGHHTCRFGWRAMNHIERNLRFLPSHRRSAKVIGHHLGSAEQPNKVVVRSGA